MPREKRTPSRRKRAHLKGAAAIRKQDHTPSAHHPMPRRLVRAFEGGENPGHGSGPPDRAAQGRGRTTDGAVARHPAGRDSSHQFLYDRTGGDLFSAHRDRRLVASGLASAWAFEVRLGR